MDTDTILSFSTPFRDTSRIEVIPSPVLELAYSHYFLSQPHKRRQVKDLDWFQLFSAEHPSLLRELEAFWPKDQGTCTPGEELFVMACSLGYTRDKDPSRFIQDLPKLFKELLTKLDQTEPPEEAEPRVVALRARLEQLQDKKAARAYKTLLTRLWEALEPLWHASGHEAVQAECGHVRAKLDEGEDVTQVLPRHYFGRGEGFEQDIRQHRERGGITISPLYFSAGGGYNFDIEGTLFIGYGLRTESAFAQLSGRTQTLAPLVKALADPTRLMILALIRRTPVTVSDLAHQLEVTQPTISGHLKLLRDAELVTLERKGTKAYYQVNDQKVHEVLQDVGDLLTR